MTEQDNLINVKILEYVVQQQQEIVCLPQVPSEIVQMNLFC